MQKVELGKLEKQSYAKREALNSLRTNLTFCGADIQVVIFTSCTPNEGKSSTVMGLGRSLAEHNKRTLIMDCDLRKSVLIGRHHAKKEEGKITGMTHYLSGQASLSEIILETNVENLDIIFAGRTTPNPTELLSSEYFNRLLAAAREKYDYILIDSPPLGSVIDTAVIAPECDGAVILVEAGKNSYRFLQEIKKQLDKAGVSILGTVLNKVQNGEGGYYNRYYKEYYKEYSAEAK